VCRAAQQLSAALLEPSVPGSRRKHHKTNLVSAAAWADLLLSKARQRLSRRYRELFLLRSAPAATLEPGSVRDVSKRDAFFPPWAEEGLSQTPDYELAYFPEA